MLCQGLQIAPSLLNLVFPPTWLPPSLRHSVSPSVLSVCFFSTSNTFGLFLYNLCSILVSYFFLFLLLIIISALINLI